MWIRLLSSALLLTLLAGCASGPHADPRDPLEPLNRSVMRFNDSVDAAVVRPVAVAYRDTVPAPVRTGVNNFFGNWRDLWSALNAALQARPQQAAENFMRFNVNTFMGLGGVLDIATEMGIPRTTLDVGHTLARWGVPPGPYLVLPLMGPSTVRDSLGMVVDAQGDLVTQGVDHATTQNTLVLVRIVDGRTELLPATDMLDQIALDRYVFVRDAHLQRRLSQIGRETESVRYDLDE
jgi:phospholipid-binding lipoprotein MlaA